MSNSITRFFSRLWKKLFGRDDKPKTQLPMNPVLPDSGTREQWSFLVKDYDNSFRVRWPTHFATECGAKSYCTVDGVVFPFRSYDTDNGAKRPSYQHDQYPLAASVTCVLFTDYGKAVGWFRASAPFNVSGRLP